MPFACEGAATEPIPGIPHVRGALRLSRLADYPVNGFVVDVGVVRGNECALGCGEEEDALGPCALAQAAQLVGAAAAAMQAADVPFNVLITQAGARVFIWPQVCARVCVWGGGRCQYLCVCVCVCVCARARARYCEPPASPPPSPSPPAV